MVSGRCCVRFPGYPNEVNPEMWIPAPAPPRYPQGLGVPLPWVGIAQVRGLYLLDSGSQARG